MKISKKSTWTEGEIEVFLAAAKTPMRLAFNDRDGFPAVCSLWFYFDEGCFWAASHKNSHVIKMLKQSEKVSLEVATNEYPYKGVRGKANVELTMDGASAVLNRLIDRYLVDGNNKLADWLLSRVADEYVLKSRRTCLMLGIFLVGWIKASDDFLSRYYVVKYQLYLFCSQNN